MITYNWNKEKHLLLKETRGVSFEQIVMHIEKGDLVDIIKHPNSEKYANQKILVVNIKEYIYTVPFVENVSLEQNNKEWFLKPPFPKHLTIN